MSQPLAISRRERQANDEWAETPTAKHHGNLCLIPDLLQAAGVLHMKLQARLFRTLSAWFGRVDMTVSGL
jgi:hypothetical protein